MKTLKKLRSSMSFNIIGAIVLLLALFGALVCVLGVMSYREDFMQEYSTTTHHIADTAAVLVNGDHLDEYLQGRETEEYARTARGLQRYCELMHVSMIYIIKVDTSDYGRFVSVFNPVNNAVDDTSYTEWEIGHQRDTTNEEYQTKYRAIYEQTSEYEIVFRLHPTDGQKEHITAMVPLHDSAGNVAAILCVQRPAREINNAIQPFLSQILLSVIVLSLLSAAIAACYIRRQFVEPVTKVSHEATRFATENTKGEPLGNISNIASISDLAASIDKMETDMVTYIDNLTAVTAERERNNAELALAREIQENSIPTGCPAFPDRHDFDILGSMTPAKGVGGDFYNFFLIDDDHLGMVIGDVSGKGVPAALFMMVSNIVLSERARMGGTPAEVLAFVNDSICEHNTADMFVTIWLGILEFSTGRLIAANAGHEDAAIFHAGKKSVENAGEATGENAGQPAAFALHKTKHGLPIGAMPGVRYKDFELQLQPGDKLFLYTDGVPEATDSGNQMFGLDRMIDALNACKDGSPQQILEGIHTSVNTFVGEAPQFDDLTMLCLELKTPASST